MENLIIQSNAKVRNVSLAFRRYLLDEIHWESRLIAVKGARGTGKTTLLLQYMALHLPKDGASLYVAMDDLFFVENNLVELADEFYKSGGKHLLLDEVHKYPNWSRELKLIYDNYPDLKVIFTSSSILEIYKAESDLSRRAVSYDLKELSLREFVELDSGTKISAFSLEELLKGHQSIAEDIIAQIKPIQVFNKYIKYGAYPYYREGVETYEQRLKNTINLIIDVDLNAVDHMNYLLLSKIKKLLFAISTSVPFTPNVSKLSERIGVSRPTLLQALHQLERARLILAVNKSSKGIGALTKPDKVYLNNTNILYALSPDKHVEKGTVRETFFVNQLQGILPVHLADKGDFLINDRYTFEVGGKNKTRKQVQGVDNAYVVRDDIETGFGNYIPLWIFGFLY